MKNNIYTVNVPRTITVFEELTVEAVDADDARDEAAALLGIDKPWSANPQDYVLDREAWEAFEDSGKSGPYYKRS